MPYTSYRLRKVSLRSTELFTGMAGEHLPESVKKRRDGKNEHVVGLGNLRNIYYFKSGGLWKAKK